MIDDVTIYLITVPIYQSKSEEIREALIENIISKYCVPDYIIMGPGQCIYVNINELPVQEIWHENQDHSTIQPSINASTAWN